VVEFSQCSAGQLDLGQPVPEFRRRFPCVEVKVRPRFDPVRWQGEVLRGQVACLLPCALLRRHEQTRVFQERGTSGIPFVLCRLPMVAFDLALSREEQEPPSQPLAAAGWIQVEPNTTYYARQYL
jgi:hypothetical protein